MTTKEIKCRIVQGYLWLWGWMPMFRRTHNNKLCATYIKGDAKLTEERVQHKKERASDRESIGEISRHFAESRYRRHRENPHLYTLQIDFDQSICSWSPGALSYLAEDISRRVRHEIVTTKFVRSANEEEQRLRGVR